MKKFVLLASLLIVGLSAVAQSNLERGKTSYNNAREWSWNREHNYKEALKYLQAAAKEGYGEACYLLGNMYRQGLGVDQNHTIAFRMYNRALEFGYSEGELELGECCYFGQGCAKNYEKAFSFFLSSAKKGNREAKKWVGYCYDMGHGVEADQATAYSWLSFLENDYSADEGYEMGILGRYRENHGDYKTAATYYLHSGIVSFMVHGAYLMDKHSIRTVHFKGHGTYVKAGVLWKAMERGCKDPEVYYYYALWRDDQGNGMAWGPTRLNALTYAAESGFGPAQKLLGDWYKEGTDVSVNLLKAREWYAKAKANGEEVPEL